jgi:energy-coupling factor transporter ATP-binding protein EcfA2
MVSKSVPAPLWRITRVKLQNIRAFRSFTIDFASGTAARPAPSVIIGTNGTGKTTLLRAMALALVGPKDASGLVPLAFGGLVGEHGSEGQVEVRLSDERGSRITRSLTLKRSPSGDYVETGIDGAAVPQGGPPLVAAYGVARGRKGKSGSRPLSHFDAVETLFNYDATLVPPELSLRRLKDFAAEARYNRLLAALKRALELASRTAIELKKGGGIAVSGPGIGQHIPLEGLADGYRINLSWIFDLFNHALTREAFDAAGKLQGILLVDEIEQHSHPSIQRSLLAKLQRLLPGLQIIVTTHSPIVLLGVPATQVIALRRSGSRIVRAPNAHGLRGMSAEDVLTDSRLFQTPAYSEEIQREVDVFDRAATTPPQQRTQQQKLQMRKAAKKVAARTAVAPPTKLAQELQALQVKYGLK